jgi:hypothetical protein
VRISLRSERGITPSKQDLIRFGDDPVDNLGGRWNIMDQPDRLPRNHGRDVEIAASFGRRIFSSHGVHVLQQLNFAADPAARMVVDQAASGKRRRPDIVSREIEDNAPDGAATPGRADPQLGFIGAIGFLAGIKARAEQHAASAEHHHRRQPAAICDAARGDHRHTARRKIDDRRHDIDRRAGSSVPTRLSALRDQDVGASIKRLPRHVLALHLTDQQRTGSLDARRKGLRITK